MSKKEDWFSKACNDNETKLLAERIEKLFDDNKLTETTFQTIITSFGVDLEDTESIIDLAVAMMVLEKAGRFKHITYLTVDNIKVLEAGMPDTWPEILELKGEKVPLNSSRVDSWQILRKM